MISVQRPNALNFDYKPDTIELYASQRCPILGKLSLTILQGLDGQVSSFSG